MKTNYKILNIYISFGILATIIFGSCISSKSRNLLQDKKPIYASRPFVDYKLQYNDEIHCAILTNNQEFSNEFNGIVSTNSYTIYSTGNISIPYFGEINIVGRTLEQAEEIIQNRMRQSFPDAQVKITLRNNSYYIVSEHQNGRYELYKDNTTIFQALAISGRPSDRLDSNKVKIVRTDETGRSYVKVFDLHSESIIESEFYYIKPNDIIYYSTNSSAFFRIDSFQSLLSTILLPVSIIGTILAIKAN